MLYGYVRRVRGLGNTEKQLRAVEVAGASAVVQESSSSLRRLTALGEMIRALRPGDRVLVADLAVLPASKRRLAAILAAIEARGASLQVLSEAGGNEWHDRLADDAARERELVSRHLCAGRRRARASGVRLGRPTKMSPVQRDAAVERRFAGEELASIATSYGVSRSTIGTLVKNAEASRRSGMKIVAEIHLGSHLALDPSGHWQTIQEFRVLRDQPQDSTARFFRLDSGQKVNLVDDRTFEVVATGERLTSVW